MAFDPRQIEAFKAVVDHGSIGKAADKLNVSQPALSRIIKRLEDRLEVSLFERHAKGMLLTQFGRALLPYANALETESKDAIDRLATLRGVEGGNLRIGTVGSVAVAELPQLLRRMHIRYPKLQMEIVQDVQDRLVDMLSNDQIDVAIADEIVETEDILRINSKPFEDTHTIVAAAGHPLARKHEASESDLCEAHWVMPGRSALPRRQLDQIFVGLGLDRPHVAIECRSPSTIKAVVAQTHLLGWLPAPMVATEISAGVLAPINNSSFRPVRELRAYHRKRAFLSPQLRYFVKCLTEGRSADADQFVG